MAREDGLVEFPASPKQLEEALERLYKGQTNVAVQAQDLGMPLERLKQLCTAYVMALCLRPWTESLQPRSRHRTTHLSKI